MTSMKEWRERVLEEVERMRENDYKSHVQASDIDLDTTNKVIGRALSELAEEGELEVYRDRDRGRLFKL